MWLVKSKSLHKYNSFRNSENNSEDNLRLICPNCHSLTSTYRGANRGQGRNITWIIKDKSAL